MHEVGGARFGAPRCRARHAAGCAVWSGGRRRPRALPRPRRSSQRRHGAGPGSWQPLAAPAPPADPYNLISLMGHAARDLLPTDQRRSQRGNIPPGFLRPPHGCCRCPPASPPFLVSPFCKKAPRPLCPRAGAGCSRRHPHAASRGCGGVPASPPSSPRTRGPCGRGTRLSAPPRLSACGVPGCVALQHPFLLFLFLTQKA